MAELTDPDAIREQVREKYAAAARAAAADAAAPSSCCGPAEVPLSDASGTQVFGDALYDPGEVAGAERAVGASLGCGAPTAVAHLHEGETVLDLGSGAGADVLISARRVGVTGRAIGLDMTDEMLDLARANAQHAGITNVEFVRGHIEDIPLAGALTCQEFEDALHAARLVDVEIRETHRVHAQAGAAIIRASKPTAAGCCSATVLQACCEPAAKADCRGEAAATRAPSNCSCDPA